MNFIEKIKEVIVGKKSRAVASIEARPEFKNGDYVRDVVTGLEGAIVAITIWLNGCVRYVVQPAELKDGRPVDGTAVDKQQLELLERYERAPGRVPLTGGTRDDSRATGRNDRQSTKR